MPARRRRSTALAVAVATAAALGATALAAAGATSAAAAGTPLEDYELTWGIKESYRSYVTGTAKGTFTLTEGASQAPGNGAFTFVDGTGSYESTGHTVNLAFRGGLAIESRAHGFALTLSDVRFDSKDAEITADVTRDGTTTQDVPLATVAVTRRMTDMATTLTAEAAEVFGSASYEGAAGDPLTVAHKPAPTPTEPEPAPSTSESTPSSPDPDPDPEPTPSVSSSTSTSPAPGGSPEPSASPGEAPAQGEIAYGTLGWGVKESFRTYVVGPLAKGTITTSGGASQAADNGPFTFADATGTYDTEADRLTASFEGAVTFKGHEKNGGYGLDLTLTDLEAGLDGGSGTLTADVTSLGETSQDVVLADLEAGSADLTAEDDVITVDGVAATLTQAGAKAFGGFYDAGAALDPVDLAVALNADADLPDGSGSGSGSTGGSGGTTAGGTTSGGTGSTTGGTGTTTGAVTGGSLATTGSEIPAGALGTAAAVAVAAGAGVVLAMRRRRTAGER
ncbi:HtaA domain-containing protein [Streptomyces poriticola]|uniref:HtaA domain-containing protein n=1 Tax=Streptomyces poriticola TaxID=3120506 RepID=UPI002FCDF764